MKIYWHGAKVVEIYRHIIKKPRAFKKKIFGIIKLVITMLEQINQTTVPEKNVFFGRRTREILEVFR